MSRRVRAIVKPELLVWARKSIGLSIEEASKKIQVSTDGLREWESGNKSPTINQLRKASNVYKRPLAVFYLPEPPKTFDAMRDFRRLPGRMTDQHSPKLNLEIRLAHMRREIALDLYNQLGYELPSIEFQASTEDPEYFAIKVRQSLGIAIEEQFDWKGPYKPLNSWIALLERMGILVFQVSGIELMEMRGFSIGGPKLPVVVANAKDSPKGRIFTLIHEFAHILLDKGGLCDMEFDDVRTEEQKIEVFCNHVAGSILVPKAAFLQEEVVKSKSQKDELSDEDLMALAEKYSVSQEVILRRLLTLGLISLHFYRRKREEFLEIYKQIKRKSEDFIFTPDRKAIRDLGKSYIRLVLDAYHQEVINPADLSDFLGLRLKHIPKIESEIMSWL